MDQIAYSLKPIGFMKSVFHYKNGTPRQPSLCENARGVLTIEKSVFNNPEHSLDGLQDFSHAWILFLFHKNNNAHKKAKVKPPRLDGKRVGVFSTRSPYRPNNVGLSLAKIDKIHGAAIHFCGIDILDGTPIIDIKPYIPEYDKPSIEDVSSPDQLPPVVNDCSVSRVNKTNKCENFFEQWKETCQNQSGGEMRPCAIDSVVLPACSSQTEESQKKTKTFTSSDDNLTKSSALTSQPSTTAFDSVEEGFYSLSAALDRAGACLRHRDRENDKKDDEKELTSLSETLSQSIAATNIMGKIGSKGEDENDEDVLDFLVGDVIFRAASDVLFAGNTSPENNLEVLSDNFSSSKSSNGAVAKENNGGGLDCKSSCAVTAPWLSSPPVSKVNVLFTPDALQQLQEFHSNSTDPRFKTEMLTDSEDAKKAIISILHEEPRSVYRRQKCQNSLYFFAIDVLHVTCQFDRDVVTVQRIRPVGDVPQLQEREKKERDSTASIEKEKDASEIT